MTQPQQRLENIEPSPLNKDEILVLVGAVIMAVGVLLPASTYGYGATESFRETGNVASLVLWGFSGAAAWSVTRRRADGVRCIGVISLALLATYGSFLWAEDAFEPVQGFFGVLKTDFRPSAWITIAVGAVLIAFAGHRAKQTSSPKASRLTPAEQMAAAGVTLAILGGLFGVGITNPFGRIAGTSLRELGRTYGDELEIARRALLAVSTFAIVLCFQNPRLARRVMKSVLYAAGLIIGNFVLIVLSPVGIARWVMAFWSAYSVAIIASAAPGRPLARWKLLLICFPFIAIAVLLLAMGEIGDAMIMLPSLLAVGTGYVLCRNTTFVDTATFTAALLLGIPTGSMAAREVPNEFLESCGMTAAEGRLMSLGICCLLGWTVYLSFAREQGSSDGIVAPRYEFAGQSDGTADPQPGTDTETD